MGLLSPTEQLYGIPISVYSLYPIDVDLSPSENNKVDLSLLLTRQQQGVLPTVEPHLLSTPCVR